MKNLFCCCFLLCCISASAQKIERYYDVRLNPCEKERASFYCELFKTDSGWLAKNFFLGTGTIYMKGLYKDSVTSIQDGEFQYFHVNGFLKSTGRFENNQKEGLWISYYSNGYMSDSAYYVKGKKTGIVKSWARNGYLTDSVYIGPDGKSVAVQWFSNGQLSSAGRLDEEGNPYGKWQFFNKAGKLVSAETYQQGKIIQITQYDEKGEIKTDTTVAFTPASFKGGGQGWANYLSRNAVFPPTFILKTDSPMPILIELEVDEEGKVDWAEVVVPLHPDLDKIALRAVKESPNWIPARGHNRNIRQILRQSISYRNPKF